ncbi:MAG: 2-C-methyl-D-erythritol 4-phosphate cytidylyltransferase [Solirubrobacterales bacterium]
MIAAAGSGQRLGAGGAKAFVELAGRPMVEWSLKAFAAAQRVGKIVVAIPPGAGEPGGALAPGAGEPGGALAPGAVEFVEGGESRSDSVTRALERVQTEIVVIHDAARPLVTAELIDGVIAALEARGDLDGLVAAAPVTDTVKRVDERLTVVETPERSSLWAVQTPQAFRTEALRRAHAAGDLAAATDDASLVEAGGTVAVHPAPPGNLKVTTPLDLRVAEMLLAERPVAPESP